MSDAPFELHDCGVARFAAGQSCASLRDLLGAIRGVPDEVLEHHLMRCVLEDDFELHEFPNDFARWCWNGLGDHGLGEELGLVDPYRHGSMLAVRRALSEMVERAITTADGTVIARRGHELHLLASRLVSYDTGERFETPAALAEAIPRFSPRSLFIHVHEARRRTGGRSDDLSAWLEQRGADPRLVGGLRAIDFYFLNLSQLRDEFAALFRQFMPESVTAAGAAA